MYEVEVKAALRDRESIIKKLTDFGCTFSEELHQIDTIFTPQGINFPPPLGTPVLRVRNSNNRYLLTLKISQSSKQDCIEHELKISEQDQMEKIISLLGYKLDVTVDKKRIKTKYQDMEIVLDTVKDLGEYIEAEKITSEPDPEARKKIQDELLDFLYSIGISRGDVVVDGKYDIMLFEKFNKK